jgi:hypothetical protein
LRGKKRSLKSLEQQEREGLHCSLAIHWPFIARDIPGEKSKEKRKKESNESSTQQYRSSLIVTNVYRHFPPSCGWKNQVNVCEEYDQR